MECVMKRRVLAVLLAGVLAFSNMGTALSAEIPAAGSTAAETAAAEASAEQMEAEEDEEAEASRTESVEQQEDEAQNPETTEAGGEDAEEAEVIEAAGGPEDGEQEGEAEDEGGSEAEEGEDAEETAEADASDAGLTEEAATEATEEAASVEEPVEEETAVIEETVTEELSKEALADGEGYWIQIHDWEGPNALYSDGVWSCPLEVRGFEGTEYELQAAVVGYVGPDSASTDGVCWIAGEPGNERFYIDGRILKSEGITWVKVRAAGVVEGNIIDESSREFNVNEPREEYDREYDRVMLPGWDGTVSGSYDAYIENSEYPQGHNERYFVTDVEIVSDTPWEGENGNVITDFHRDQKSDDDYWWYYRAGHRGEATLKVTYMDLHGDEEDYTFTLHVGGDAYSVYMDSDGGERNAFPGSEIRLSADARHQYMDDNGGYHEDADGLGYDWVFEQGEDFARIEVDDNDPSRATLIFNDLPEGQDEINEHVRVGVRILDENGNETEGYDSTGFWVRSYYTELWPLRLDWGLDVGASLENVGFEVRQYTFGEEGFRVLDEDYAIEYEWNYDENAVSITEMREGESVEIHNAETAKGNVFTITRKKPWGTDYSVRAYWTDDNGRDQDCYGNYRFWNKNYDLWFEKHDIDLYTDTGEVPEGVLNVESLGESWQNRLDLELLVGYWDHDNWNGMLDAAEYTVVNNGGEVRVALTKAYLSTIEDHRDIRIEVGVFLKGEEHTNENRLADTDMWFHIQMAKEEYEREYDRTMLPGWDGTVRGSYNVYIENSENPEGRDERYFVTNVEKISDLPWEGENGSVIVDLHRDQNGEDDYWWYYRTEHRGEATLKVTYVDLHGEEKSYEFKLYVGDDVYRVEMNSYDGIRNAFPGGEIELFANAFHEYYDEYGQYHNDWNRDVGFSWTIEQGEEFARIEVNEEEPSLAKLKFYDLPDGWDRIDEHVRVGVRVLDQNGNETEAYTSTGFWVRTDYTEVWPLELDSWVDAGVGHEDVKFEVRRYTFGEEDYQVLDDDFEVRYEWHYDENAVSVTETVGDSAVPVPDGEVGAGHIFTITRKQSWHTDYSVKAFWRENGEDRDVWGNYRFDEINYDFWFDIDGNDAIYSDGVREFGFNLDNVAGSDFELIPEVGNGEWNEGTGFAEPIAEGSCWTYDPHFHTIKFDGEALQEAGIYHFSARISLRVNGIEVRDEWRDFHVEDPQYDFWGLGDEVLFVGEDRYWNRNGDGYVRNNWYPDGQQITYTITSLDYDFEEDPFDTRSPVKVTEDEYGWKFDAIRTGEQRIDIGLQIDDGILIRATHNYETSYRFTVGGFRANLGLHTDTGSDRMQSGGEITVYPEIHAQEYDWETGEHREVDHNSFLIRYDVRCDRLADRLVDELYNGDFERATQRGELWDYVENLDGSIRLISNDDRVYEMELVVDAALVEKETDNEVAHASFKIFIDRVIIELLLLDDQGQEMNWNEDMVPGEIVQTTPRLMRNAVGGDFTPVSEQTDVLYKLNWYTGGGENDPAHITVWDKDHNPLDPGTWVTEEDFPLEIQRLVEWDFNFSIEAQWKDDEGRDQGINRQLRCENAHYSDGWIRNNDRGDYGYTWYYIGEEINITPDRAKLDELIAQGYPVDLTVEMGFWRENETIEPIIRYEIGEDGHRGQEIGEYDTSAIFSEETGLHVSGEALEDLEEMLRYQNSEWGYGNAVLHLKFCSELNGVKLVDHILRVEISRPYLAITDFKWDMGVGQTKTWTDGQAELYLEDAGHDDGGEYFDITITGIALRNQEDSEYVDIARDGEDWTLTALKVSDRPIPLIFTFTGGPEEYDTLEGGVMISEGVFDLEFRDADGEKVDELRILIGQTEKVIPYATYTERETVTVLSPVKGNGYYYKVRGKTEYDDHVISYDEETGDVTGIQNGSTNLQMVIDIYDENDEPCYALWTFANILVSSKWAELSAPEDAVFRVKPGQTYTAQEIIEAIGPTLTVYSMKEPEGKEYPISGYGLEEVIGGEEKLLLSEMADGAFQKLSVDTTASEGEAILIFQAWEDHGARAGAGCKLIIENAKQPQEIDCDTSAPVVNQKTLKYTVTGTQGELTFAIADTSVATVASVNGAEVTVKGLKPGITKLIVTAAETDSFFAAEEEFEIRVVPGATSRVRATNLADCMKITWEKVEGATKYDIYRDGEYMLSTSNLYCPDKDARYKNLQKFTYKVVAYTNVNKVKLESTEARTTTYYRVMTVGVNTLSNTQAGKLKVTYTTNPASTGYVVRYGQKADLSDGKTKTIFGANTNSYTITGVKKGTTYYVQVRTFVRKPVEGGGTFDYFSTYSTIQHIKITK